MKRAIYYILATIFLAGCSNGLNKPIVETLTVEELKANIKKDSLFTAFYAEVQEIREWLASSDVNKAKWGDVTYSQIQDYMKESYDTIAYNKIIEQSRPEWEQKYGGYQAKADSIVNYWREYLKNNSVNSYVKVEFDEINTEYYSYSNEIKNINLGFRITPLRGHIDQLIFTYNLKSKIANKDIDNIYSIFDKKFCLASKPISRPKTLYWEANYSDKKALKYMSTSEVKRDYDFNIEILEVRINGENLKDDNLGIPESVEMCLEFGNYWKKDVIKEIIDPNYKNLHEITQEKMDEKMKAYDEQVHSLLFNFYKHQFDTD